MQTVELQLRHSRDVLSWNKGKPALWKVTEYSLQIAAVSQGVSLDSGIQTSASETSTCVA